MTDFDACYGEYKATCCEWYDNGVHTCERTPLPGKSYCDIHYERIFNVITEEEFEERVKDELELAEKLFITITGEGDSLADSDDSEENSVF
jgi:hypothetical protein